ncbi:MAG: tRNA epoxyqueuosine(34) reductase QueG [Steroidobacteraceae bacterium]
MTQPLDPDTLSRLRRRLDVFASELGFQQVGVAGVQLPDDEARLLQWLAESRHGGMEFMSRHGLKRSRPAELIPGTLRVISVRMNCFAPDGRPANEVLADPELAYIARYALGRDYHHILRPRLQKLASRLEQEVGPFGYRAFVDSAPVMEKPLARNAGLGWIGKHTNLINSEAGSQFVLGELFTDLPLPLDTPASDHCGSCTACMPACPTGAITAPYQLDARLCISYLTIEHHGPIPEALRPAIGNRIFGCDDCQLACPWNKFAQLAADPGFRSRNGLDAPALVDLFGWSEGQYLARTEGSALRRLGYRRFLRNVALGLGNAPPGSQAIEALSSRRADEDLMVREQVAWSLERQLNPSTD